MKRLNLLFTLILNKTNSSQPQLVENTETNSKIVEKTKNNETSLKIKFIIISTTFTIVTFGIGVLFYFFVFKKINTHVPDVPERPTFDKSET